MLFAPLYNKTLSPSPIAELAITGSDHDGEPRKQMQDTALFGLLPSHYFTDISDEIKKTILANTSNTLAEAIKAKPEDEMNYTGSTLTAVLIDDKKGISWSNIGDGWIISCDFNKGAAHLKLENALHHVSRSELELIKNKNNIAISELTFYDKYPSSSHKLGGRAECTRALGDHELIKDCHLHYTPDTGYIPSKNNTFVIVASDGLFAGAKPKKTKFKMAEKYLDEETYLQNLDALNAEKEQDIQATLETLEKALQEKINSSHPPTPQMIINALKAKLTELNHGNIENISDNTMILVASIKNPCYLMVADGHGGSPADGAQTAQYIKDNFKNTLLEEMQKHQLTSDCNALKSFRQQ